MSPTRIKATVLVCHFAGAFGPMGLPPFLGLILAGIAPGAGDRLIGWLYIVPTACLALAAPFWGRLADRWGRKPLLLRAQIGLAISFLLAGLAGSLPVFVIALCLQGLLGGTFSASNAYLSEALPRRELSQALNLTQASARLALILSPVAVGLLIDAHFVPQNVYFVVALLPLAAVAMLLPLPARGAPTSDIVALAAGAAGSRPAPPPLPRGAIMAAQTGFTLAMISTFPFLVPYSMKAFGVGAGTAGWLFGVPHIVYLFACLPLGRHLRDRDPAPWFAAGCLIVAAMLAVQAGTVSLALFTIARLAMGMGMTLGYVALNAMIARTIEDASAGRMFGWFDSGAKLATIAASIGGGVIAAGVGITALFLAAALCGVLTAVTVLRLRGTTTLPRSAAAE
ncbi:MFS transporter [Sphingomonas pokkalii]|uniref:MFS transporter n=1 Tax=Sphingomonas pokkalii TaxID=2175090 RepID=A0A2U0SD67_9SPHN|nr:MFS transporter [Sphingomonas pokkalii]PVX29289.1 MFS transporter [Sphingomonas pokkalii]